VTGALLLAAFLRAAGPASIPASAQEPPDRRGAVTEQAFVERVIVDAHVTAPNGTPIPGLTPTDFRVRVDGKPVLLESVDWIPAGAPEVDAAPPEAGPGEGGEAAPWPSEVAPGRLIVMFFQTNYEPSRLIGLVRMAAQARQFLYTMLPSDRVAVASYDSHLKLRQDFTDDHGKILRAINASLTHSREPEPDPESHPALARHLDPEAARKAATPERALALLANALTPIPGGKSMLYFGWGLGTVGGLSGPNPAESRAWSDAMHGMAAARVSIFTLDVTNADYHSLEGYLEQISDLTGGRYEKTHIFPGLAMERVERAISGRYVLVFVKPRLPRGVHEIRVDLVGHKGEVSARQYYTD
jgi:VWFA-related protein